MVSDSNLLYARVDLAKADYGIYSSILFSSGSLAPSSSILCYLLAGYSSILSFLLLIFFSIFLVFLWGKFVSF